MKKRYLALFLTLAMVFTLTACAKKETKVEEGTPQATAGQEAAQSTPEKEKKYVEMKVKGYGTMQIELDPNVAPDTVDNFMNLVHDEFYNGLTFHRIIPGFMIQGGDPLGDGTGGSEHKVRGEFAANGFANPLGHTRGVISMARAADYNSASSQFFIMHQDYPSLDGQYAAFGQVINGIEVVDKICEDVQTEDSNGSVKAKNQPVIKYIKEIEKPN